MVCWGPPNHVEISCTMYEGSASQNVTALTRTPQKTSSCYVQGSQRISCSNTASPALKVPLILPYGYRTKLPNWFGINLRTNLLTCVCSHFWNLVIIICGYCASNLFLKAIPSYKKKYCMRMEVLGAVQSSIENFEVTIRLQNNPKNKRYKK